MSDVLNIFGLSAGNKTTASNLSKMTQSVAESFLNEQSSQTSLTTIATADLFQRLKSTNDTLDCGTSGVANVDFSQGGTTKSVIFVKLDATQKANYTNEIANKLLEYAQQTAKSSGGDNTASFLKFGTASVGNRVESKNSTVQNTKIQTAVKNAIRQSVNSFVDASQRVIQFQDFSGLKIKAGAGCNVKFSQKGGIELQVTSLANSLQDAIVSNILKNDVSQTSKQTASATQGTGSLSGGGMGGLIAIIGVVVAIIVFAGIGIAIFAYMRSRSKNKNLSSAADASTAAGTKSTAAAGTKSTAAGSLYHAAAATANAAATAAATTRTN